jgi:drug/metabolite transporter (DMT)-like permease
MPGSTGRRILGYSVMGIAIAGLVILFFAYVIYNYSSNSMSTLNNTLIGAGSQVVNNVGTALQQAFNVTYSDPFVSTTLGYLRPVAYFLYAVVTNERLFFTLVAVDLILMAFDVTWIEESEE